MSFDDKLKNRVLLWCDRHCCLCRKSCSVNIEVHHIIAEGDGGSNEEDNAIPLCFDCHGIVGHYNSSQPKGNKFKPDELKARRGQVYDEYTRHLVPPIFYNITQTLPDGRGARAFPDVGFVLAHRGESLPVKVRTIVQIVEQNGNWTDLDEKHYSGERLWNLNPGFKISGHFLIPTQVARQNEQLRLRVNISIIDQIEKEHRHLPVEYIYDRSGNFWFLNPSI